MEKWASKWPKCVLRYTDFTNFSGGGPLPLMKGGSTPSQTPPSRPGFRHSVKTSAFSAPPPPPPGNNISGSGPERLATEIRDIGFLSTYYEYFV